MINLGTDRTEFGTFSEYIFMWNWKKYENYKIVFFLIFLQNYLSYDL